MMLVSVKQKRPVLIFCGLVAGSLAGLLLLPPIPQDQGYHHFADQRMLFGVPITLCFMAILAVVVEERKTGGCPAMAASGNRLVQSVAVALDRRSAALRLGAILSLPCIAAAVAVVPAEIYRHVLLGHRGGALCARQAVRISRLRGKCEFHLERAYAQASFRGYRLFRGAEIFPDAPGCFTRNQAMYSAGRKINVSTVATSNPPMIA